MKKLFLVLGLISATSFASNPTVLSLDQVQSIADAGISVQNSIGRLSGHSDERLFTGYAPITAQSCKTTGNIIQCQFDTTEAQDRDQDVYTPNILTVKLNTKTGAMTVSLEMGC